MTKSHRRTLSQEEAEHLLKTHPKIKIGQVISFCRPKPHTSKNYPFLHLDVFRVRYDGELIFTVLCKDHLPFTGYSNE